ncbi:cell division protein FtsQ/DivIB [Thermosulfurimonas dismutans]|uniref:Cell division protein FtsQ n=1 Tax=Thermosulfurimonas dismutans TaxID=999894 RepID=A0A179D2X0_9BACT|nr:FtsQ-type POTRA domain-containing protein [Thermosulfurimonas dismutans]OAQ20141.1 hypothetical protein TDIS_1767 [Thermosulfurimonas dismutans]
MARLRRVLFIGLAGIFLLIGLVYGSSLFLKRLTLFSLKKVKISGLSHVKEAEVKELISVSIGENLFRIDLSDIKRRLEAHPWIKKVYLMRNLPHTLEIRVEEERPVAVTNLSGKLYFLNERGEAFSPASEKDLLSYPIVSFKDKNLLKEETDFLRLLAWVRDKNFYLPCYENISQVYLARDRILLITKAGLKVRFEPEPFEELKKAYRRLDKIMTYLYQNRLYARAESVRLDYPGDKALLVYRREK